MGLVSLLPVLAFLLARPDSVAPAAGRAAETLGPVPALAAAIVLVGAVRLARGGRRTR